MQAADVAEKRKSAQLKQREEREKQAALERERKFKAVAENRLKTDTLGIHAFISYHILYQCLDERFGLPKSKSSGNTAHQIRQQNEARGTLAKSSPIAERKFMDYDEVMRLAAEKQQKGSGPLSGNSHVDSAPRTSQIVSRSEHSGRIQDTRARSSTIVPRRPPAAAKAPVRKMKENPMAARKSRGTFSQSIGSGGNEFIVLNQKKRDLRSIEEIQMDLQRSKKNGKNESNLSMKDGKMNDTRRLQFSAEDRPAAPLKPPTSKVRLPDVKEKPERSIPDPVVKEKRKRESAAGPAPEMKPSTKDTRKAPVKRTAQQADADLADERYVKSNLSNIIGSIFGYDRRKFVHEHEDDLSDMEASADQIEREEKRRYAT